MQRGRERGREESRGKGKKEKGERGEKKRLQGEEKGQEWNWHRVPQSLNPALV